MPLPERYWRNRRDIGSLEATTLAGVQVQCRDERKDPDAFDDQAFVDGLHAASPVVISAATAEQVLVAVFLAATSGAVWSEAGSAAREEARRAVDSIFDHKRATPIARCIYDVARLLGVTGEIE